MRKYPLEAAEPEAFTPASLKDIENAPVLHLRYGTPRDREQQRRVMDEEGAVMHTDQAMRDELIKGLRELLGDEAGQWEAEARSFWDAQEAFEKEVADIPEAERPKFAFENEDLLMEVLEQVARDWRPFRRMQADNNAYSRFLGHAMNSVIIVGVENLDVEIKRVGKYVSFDTAMAIADKLDTIARDHKISTGIRPSQELGLECIGRLHIGKERAGNSASPAPSEPTPESSKTGTEPEAGPSQAPARSKRTRATS